MFLFSVVMVFWGLVVFLADKGMGVAALGVIFGGYMLIARMYANRSAKVMAATVHTGIERSLINCSQTEQIIEEMLQRYIAGTGRKRKLGAWHRFKIRHNRPAQQSIAYLFKITQCLEVFSTLLPAVALEQYSSEKAKQALVGIKEKIEPSVK